MAGCESGGCDGPAELRLQSTRSDINETFRFCRNCAERRQREYGDLEVLGEVTEGEPDE